MNATIVQQIKEFPEYFFALKGAVLILLAGVPLYLALWYFLHRRKMKISVAGTFNFLGVFILFAGLAFLQASPLSSLLPARVITVYLFVTCIVAAHGVVTGVDVFLLQYYLVQVKHAYISPPLRTVIKLSIFCVSLLPILRFVLDFNPLALVAIPTIATAGIAFALQDTLKTFIAGIALGNIIRLGEWIRFQDIEGRVTDINWARTVIETIDGQQVFIPNSQLQTGSFTNYTHGSLAHRETFKVSVSSEAPPAKVKTILLNAIADIPGINSTPAPVASLVEFADSGVNYGLFYWVDNYGMRFNIKDHVATRIWYAFQREGIDIPYPTRRLLLERKSHVDNPMQNRIEEELGRFKYADAFLPEEIAELSASTRYRLFAPGEILIRQGEAGQSLYSIMEGEAEVVSGDSPDRVLAVLTTRDIFGEMTLLTGARRSATVRAKTSLGVLEIGKSGMQAILSHRPEIAERLAELVAERQAALVAIHAAQQKESNVPSAIEDNRTLARRIRQFFGLG